MKLFPFLVSFLTFPLLSNAQQKLSEELLENFMWTNRFDDSCASHFQFELGGSYKHWNCEWNYEGMFEITNDTLIIYKYLPKVEQANNDPQAELWYLYKYVLRDRVLLLVYSLNYRYNFEDYMPNPYLNYKMTPHNNE